MYSESNEQRKANKPKSRPRPAAKSKESKASAESKAIKIKSEILQTQNVIADKLRKLRAKRNSKERNLREKYTTLADSLEKVIDKTHKKSNVAASAADVKRKNQKNDEPWLLNEHFDENEWFQNDNNDDDDDDEIDVASFELPSSPPSSPPPTYSVPIVANPLPIATPPPIPQRTNKRSFVASSATTQHPLLAQNPSMPPAIPPRKHLLPQKEYNEKKYVFASTPSLASNAIQAVEQQQQHQHENALRRPIKRARSMEMTDDVDIFDPNENFQNDRRRKLSRNVVESIENGTKTDQIHANDDDDGDVEMIDKIDPESSVGDAESADLRMNNLMKNDASAYDNDVDDEQFVEFIQPNTSTPTNFIANLLKINRKNRRPTNVLPHVQFAKVDLKRLSDKRNTPHDENDSNSDMSNILHDLNTRKMDALNDGEWNENDEENYKNVITILSPDDFDDDGHFSGSADKRRKVEIALSNFNKNTIQKIKYNAKNPKSRKKVTDGMKKTGSGLEKPFIPYNQNIVYEYYDDPNELCDRLRLLLSSKSAGNSNHDQEINSIIEELRERGVIE